MSGNLVKRSIVNHQMRTPSTDLPRLSSISGTSTKTSPVPSAIINRVTIFTKKCSGKNDDILKRSQLRPSFIRRDRAKQNAAEAVEQRGSCVAHLRRFMRTKTDLMEFEGRERCTMRNSRLKAQRQPDHQHSTKYRLKKH